VRGGQVVEPSSSDSAGTSEDPKKQSEAWAETEKLVAKQISDICDIHLDDAADMLERVHRSAPNPNYKGTGPRPIYAALYDWKDGEFIIDELRKNNIKNKSPISCEQKYGPLTTQRRNLALAERKVLKDKGEICAGYIAFPAKLMVKTSFRKGSKYFMIKDFSKAPIDFSGKRD